MVYIDTKYCEKYGQLTENPLRGSTTRYVANPIVDDVDAVDPDAPADPIHPKIEYVSPSCKIIGEPSTNDLATKRWGNDDALPKDGGKTEANLIRCIQEGARINALRPGPWKPNPGWQDQRAFRQLLAAFHRTVLGPAGKFVPGGTLPPRPDKPKHTNNLLFEDLTSVGCFAIWDKALKFDPATGNKFNTLSRHRIKGAIADEANYLRRQGYTSGNTVGRYFSDKVPERSGARLERWIDNHPGSPPEALLEAQQKLRKKAVYHSLEEAAEALKASKALEHADIYSDTGDDCDLSRNCDGDDYSKPTEPLEEWKEVYDAGDPLKWSPQLKTHRRVSAIVDFWSAQVWDPPPGIKAKPKAKPVYPPCRIKSTRILRPIETPYWMTPRDKYQHPLSTRAGKPYDPDRREVRAVVKNGKTKQLYCQQAKRGRHIKRESNVRNRQQASSRPTANVIVLETRRGRTPGFQFSIRHDSESTGERFACTWIAG
jgi:hypothetical protein